VVTKLERVQIDRGGQLSIATVLVVRVIQLTLHCGCFRHASRVFEVIFATGKESDLGPTKEGAFIRAEGDHVFRSIDQANPITAEIDRIYKPE
jgi:hypothetical protein